VEDVEVPKLALKGGGEEREIKFRQIPHSEEYLNLFAGTPTFSDYTATSTMLQESTLF